jgi:hypothetical protein
MSDDEKIGQMDKVRLEFDLEKNKIIDEILWLVFKLKFDTGGLLLRAKKMKELADKLIELKIKYDTESTDALIGK